MWHLWVVVGLGTALILSGIIRFVRDRRRLSNVGLALIGTVIALPALMIATPADDGGSRAWHLIVLLGFIALYLLGYPLLTLFLLVNGVTVLRKERRSLGNALALLAGLAMLLTPLLLIAVRALVADSRWAVIGTALAMIAVGAGSYLGFCFLIFLLSALAYRRVPHRSTASHVIVLGAGLIGSRVPPLLASRLRTAQQVADAQNPPATIIPSGGRGPDEDVAEGVAMAQWLRENGVPEERILVEDEARTTQENLVFSRALLPTPQTPTIVVTTSYHVFRAALLTKTLRMKAVVVGAPTASYYVPSAFLREWVAVMRSNVVMHVVLIGSGVLLVSAGVVVSLMPF